MTAELGLTAQDIQLYDRQIRLWGIDTQKNIKNTRVLIHGNHYEITKNLILSGISHLSLLSEKPPLIESLRNLNSQLEIKIIQKFNVEDYDIIIAINQTPQTLFGINEECRQKKVLFMACHSFGLISYFFQDLITHNYTRKINEKVTKHETEFYKLEHVLAKKFDLSQKRISKKLNPIFYAVAVIYNYHLKNKKWPTLENKPELLRLRTAFIQSHKNQTKVDVDKIFPVEFLM